MAEMEGMKMKCQNYKCKKEIPGGTQKCPHCGWNQKNNVAIKKESEKEKKPEVVDLSKVLAVIASIRSRDISGNKIKKIEEWMAEMGVEREIVFSALNKLPQERIEPIIKQIISKLSHYSRRNIAELYGLYSLEINIEKYSKIVLGAEAKNAASVATIEKWLETLTPCQANYFRSSLSGMEIKEGVERYIYLSKIATDIERTKKAIILKLMIGE